MFKYWKINNINHTLIRNNFIGFFSFKCKNFNTISSNEIFKLAYINALFSNLKNK